MVFAVLAIPLLAYAQKELTPRERELLLARVEDLADRMAAAPDYRLPGELESRYARLDIELRPEPGQTLAGMSLQRTRVALKGEPGLVLAWLNQLRGSRIALTPPYSLRALKAGFELRLSAWRVQGQRPDPRAPDDDLNGLRENLEWFEKRLEALSAYIAFLQPLLDAEAVLVSAARLEQNEISLTARACDRPAREAFIQELARRAAQISKSIRLDWKGLEVQPAKAASGSGLHARDLDPDDAILLACQVDAAQVIAAWKPTSPLSGHIAAATGAPKGALLNPILKELGLPAKRLKNVLVASARLSGQPPRVKMFPGRPITLEFSRISPQNLFILLSEASRVGVIPPASGQTLTIRVRDLPVKTLVSGALWALGLVPVGDDKLMACLPAGRQAGLPKGVQIPGPAGGGAGLLDLSASDAPMSQLVDALSGRPGVTACGQDPLLTLRVRDVDGDRLLAFLLAGRERTLKRSGGKLLMLARDAHVDPQDCRTSTKAPAADRLYAVLQGNQASLALLKDGGRLRWLAEGESLQDGRELRRISTSRAVLRDAGGKLASLFPRPEPGCTGAGCPLRFDPTAIPLCRLRLAGTVVIGKQAAGALLDGEGNLYLVRVGHPVGRRCGRVARILPGKIQVELGCGREYDVKGVWVSL